MHHRSKVSHCRKSLKCCWGRFETPSCCGQLQTLMKPKDGIVPSRCISVVLLQGRSVELLSTIEKGLCWYTCNFQSEWYNTGNEWWLSIRIGTSIHERNRNKTKDHRLYIENCQRNKSGWILARGCIVWKPTRFYILVTVIEKYCLRDDFASGTGTKS